MHESICRWTIIGIDLLTVSIGTVYLGHINGGGVHAVDQLTEHHTVSEHQLIFLAAKIIRNFAKMRKFIFSLQIYPPMFEYCSGKWQKEAYPLFTLNV
jgi:hypothetical protein